MISTHPDLETKRLLIIEDAATTRLILKQGLSQAGYEVWVAENGYQGLLVFQQYTFDLILMDVNMPVMDGYDCCETLRNTHEGKSIPIIMLTGLDDHESIQKAFEVGASDFITKPINLRLLIQRIRYGLRDAARETALLRSQEQQAQLIEKLQSTQQQLIQSEKLASLGLLAAGIAHEINNPLAYVKANVTCLESYLQDLINLHQQTTALFHTDEQKNTCQALEDSMEFDGLQSDLIDLNQDIHSGFERIQHIIKSLLVLSRDQKNANQAVNLGEILEESVQEYGKVHGAVNNIALDLRDPDKNIEIDKADFLQVVRNLLSNATEAGGKDVSIHISSYVQDNRCHIDISDSGPGLADEDLQRIFDPFFTTKSPGKGVGLGLSLAYQLIHHAGGDMIAENNNTGGAIFRITLPCNNMGYKDTE